MTQMFSNANYSFSHLKIQFSRQLFFLLNYYYLLLLLSYHTTIVQYTDYRRATTEVISVNYYALCFLFIDNIRLLLSLLRYGTLAVHNSWLNNLKEMALIISSDYQSGCFIFSLILF